jgi:pSer/pThr/pTyr-binding forkhead associated (FHA) protein
MSAWKLIIEDDAGKTIVVPLARDEITIGRKEGNTIRLTERNVSRNHARLLRANGQVMIQDLESYTGVRINGDRIVGAVEIREGDLIEIGDYHLALQAEGAAKPALAGQKPPQESVPTMPVQAASAQAPALAESDDQFAGDTQRWDPPADMQPLGVGALATEEGGALADSETQRFDLPQAAGPADTTQESPHQLAVGTADPRDVTMPGVAAPEEPPDATAPIPMQPIGGVAPADLPTEQHVPSLAPPPHDQPTMPAAQLPTASTSNPALAAAVEPQPAPPPDNPALDGPTIDASELPEQTEAVMVAPGIEPNEQARFVALNTVFAGTVLTLDGDKMVMGRTEDNDLVIQHKSVSRNHARVEREGELFRIHDLGSANGVLINDAEVTSEILKDGDVVELGRVRLRYVPPGIDFTLTADEIERARVADAQGEEWDEPGTHVTSPMRSRHVEKKSGPPKALLAAAAGLIVVVLLVIVVFSGGDGEGGGEEPLPVEPTVPVDEGSNLQKKLALVETAIAQKRYEQAINEAKDAMELGGGAAAETLLAKARSAQGAQKQLDEAQAYLEEGELEKAVAALEGMADVPQAEEANTLRTNIVDRLTRRIADQAQDAHDTDDRKARTAALRELAKFNPDEAQRLRDSFRAEDGATADDPIEDPIVEDPTGTKPPRGRKKPKDTKPKKPKDDEPKEDPAAVAAKVDFFKKAATRNLLQGKTQAAIAALNKAKELNRRDAAIYRALGQAYEKAGNNKAAAKNYRKYLKLSPGAPDASAIRTRLGKLGS